MSPRILSNSQIRDFLLKASRQQWINYIGQLHCALKRYSNNPSIVPPRTVEPTPDGSCIHFVMPVLDDVYCGVKTMGYNATAGTGFDGSVIVTDPKSGILKGVAEVKVVTGVRTAMSSCIGLLRQLPLFGQSVKVTVFGTGLQAFWHAYICSKLLEGKKVTINFAYRSKPMDTSLLQKYAAGVDLLQVPLSDHAGISKLVSQSDIIFGCIPSTSPAILKKDLDTPSTPNYTYISLIGSYKSHMHECDTALIDEFKGQNAKILVDSIEHTLAESGELIDAHTEPHHLLELGQLDDSTPMPATQINEHKKVTLCKIVGLAVMDVSTAQTLLDVVE
ncbi:LAFA_0G07514g1_1 [Lachancea sp. 'fantastica']|nr:LAFA_0G07514g1_1 [Lachancea sp. 'fantastica']